MSRCGKGRRRNQGDTRFTRENRRAHISGRYTSRLCTSVPLITRDEDITESRQSQFSPSLLVYSLSSDALSSKERVVCILLANIHTYTCACVCWPTDSLLFIAVTRARKLSSPNHYRRVYSLHHK